MAQEIHPIHPVFSRADVIFQEFQGGFPSPDFHHQKLMGFSMGSMENLGDILGISEAAAAFAGLGLKLRHRRRSCGFSGGKTERSDGAKFRIQPK